MLASRCVMPFWIDFYARGYGGCISPALAERREYRRLLATGTGQERKEAIL